MDQVLRMAKALDIPKWRTLRIKVTNAKEDVEAELIEAYESDTRLLTGHLVGEVGAFRNVLAWMEQIEEALDE